MRTSQSKQSIKQFPQIDCLGLTSFCCLVFAVALGLFLCVCVCVMSWGVIAYFAGLMLWVGVFE